MSEARARHGRWLGRPLPRASCAKLCMHCERSVQTNGERASRTSRSEVACAARPRSTRLLSKLPPHLVELALLLPLDHGVSGRQGLPVSDGPVSTFRDRLRCRLSLWSLRLEISRGWSRCACGRSLRSGRGLLAARRLTQHVQRLFALHVVDGGAKHLQRLRVATVVPRGGLGDSAAPRCPGAPAAPLRSRRRCGRRCLLCGACRAVAVRPWGSARQGRRLRQRRGGLVRVEGQGALASRLVRLQRVLARARNARLFERGLRRRAASRALAGRVGRERRRSVLVGRRCRSN